jgi:hypothetical protein
LVQLEPLIGELPFDSAVQRQSSGYRLPLAAGGRLGQPDVHPNVDAGAHVGELTLSLLETSKRGGQLVVVRKCFDASGIGMA